MHVLSSHRFSSEASFENAIMMPTGKQIDSDYVSMMCLLYDGDVPDTSSLASTDTSAREFKVCKTKENCHGYRVMAQQGPRYSSNNAEDGPMNCPVPLATSVTSIRPSRVHGLGLYYTGGRILRRGDVVCMSNETFWSMRAAGVLETVAGVDRFEWYSKKHIYTLPLSDVERRSLVELQQDQAAPDSFIQDAVTNELYIPSSVVTRSRRSLGHWYCMNHFRHPNICIQMRKGRLFMICTRTVHHRDELGVYYSWETDRCFGSNPPNGGKWVL